MRTYLLTLKLIRKDNLVDNVWSFQFEPQPKLSWTPGQFIEVELPHRSPDAEGTKRWFTVSAAPFEGHVQITTRISTSTFKQALVNVPEGGELKLLAKPEGDFVWEDTDRARVFVAAGIGITPFRSILAQRAHEHKSLEVTLVYANRSDAVPFREEFDGMVAADPKFKVNYLTGLVTSDRLHEMVPNLNDCLVYVSGPEPMVEMLGNTLAAAGLPKAQIKQDFFPNYNESNY